MSAIYNLEPQPTAKVVLNTTAGDIEIELFAKQTPIASRNFLQLCLDGYYDNTLFHRLVPGFIIQGGDPTGTGSGGESSLEDGLPFEDEFHSRLRFNRRGLLGMANSGKDDNASQFFLTLGDTGELQGKNTMFGRIMGDTIYNLMKMGEGELAEGSDRPLYPYKITRTEILVNPFAGMVKRELRATAVVESAPKERKKTKRKAGKTLLSFGGGDDDDDDEGMAAPIIKKPKFNPKLISVDEPEPARTSVPVKQSAPEPVKPVQEQSIPRKKRSPSLPLPSRREQILAGLTSTAAQRPSPSAQTKDSDPESESSSDEDAEDREVTDRISRTNAQIEELKASMKRSGPAAAPVAKKKSVLENMIPETSVRGRKRGGIGGKEDPNTLKLFNAFKSKLDTVPTEEEVEVDTEPVKVLDRAGDALSQDAADDDEAELCDLHFIAKCQSCSQWDKSGAKDDEDEDVGASWMSHKLSFAKDRLGKDLEWKRKNEEELVVIDPRDKEKELGLKANGRRDGRDRGATFNARRDERDRGRLNDKPRPGDRDRRK